MHKLPNYRWVVILLGFVLAACNGSDNSVSTEEAAQLFEGLYTAEMSSFVPCAMDILPGLGIGYWLVPNDEFSQMYNNPTGLTMDEVMGTYGYYDLITYYVRFEGILTAESGKRYGPSELYIGEIQVTKALEVSRRWVGSTYEDKQVFIGCGR